MSIKATIKKHPIISGDVDVVAAVKASAWAWEKHSAGPVAWIKPIVDKVRDMRGVKTVDHTPKV